MIENLTVINLLANTPLSHTSGEVFVLKTCQRTMVLGYGQTPFYHLGNNGLREDKITDVFQGLNAYIFLLETICGLRSEVVAEYEVVAQFKDAYQEYVKHEQKNTLLLTVLEKLFQDNKKIRTDHLTEIGQLTYAGIARKLIHSRVTNGDVLILGSGVLAEDLIKLLKKKHNITVSARNDARVEELCSTHSIKSLPWGGPANQMNYVKFPFIVNTIGCDEILFNKDFFNEFLAIDNINSALPFEREMKLFIDLGSPSVIETNLTECDGVLRLEDIFRQSAKLNIEKMEKVKKAKETIALLAESRLHHLPKAVVPFDWEEFKFAY
jgi:glutamyl-tRNA reductase